jgi:hypothetical protein
VTVERLSKPAVVVVTEEFEAFAHRMAAHAGHPSLRVLVLPYPLEGRPEEEVRQIAADAYPRLLRTLGVLDRPAGR